MSYATLQDAVDGLRADNQVLTDQVIASDATATTASTDAETARTAAETAETNAKQSEILSLQYKDSAEAAVPLALSHKTDAEAAVPAAQTEKTGAEAARDTAVLTTLGPDNDKLAAIASVYGQPSLMLDFAKQSFWKQGTYPWNQDTLDPAVDLTFTRASTATYFDANGVLQTAATDQMRFDHDPLTGEPLGVLIEESRTNLAPYSEEYESGMEWAKFNSTISANVIEAPDGTMSASKLVEGTDPDTQHWLRINTATPVTESTQYTISIYAKAAERTEFNIFGGGGAVGSTKFDLQAGTATGSGEIEDVGDGWYRCSSVVTTLSDQTTLPTYVANLFDESGGSTYTGDGTSGIYLWGAQLEEGSYPTSYIPTAGAAVTRATDGMSRSLGAEYTGRVGTLFVDFGPGVYPPTEAAGPYYSSLALAKDNYGEGVLGFVTTADGNIAARLSNVGDSITPATAVAVTDATKGAKCAIAYSDTEIVYAGDGASATRSVALDTTITGAFTKLYFNPLMNTHIKSLAYYPRAMTEAELIEVTS